MFTLQWAQIENALRQGGELGDSAITALSQLGNCVASLQHRGPIELVSSYPDSAPFPLDFDSIDGAIAPLKVDNPFSFLDSNNKVHNGFAAFFRGIVNIDGGLIIRNARNNPANPAALPGGPGGGGVVPPYGPGGSSAPPTGGITIINNNGQPLRITALHVADATSTITARSTTTLGTGPANRRVLVAGVVTGFVEAVTVLNPFDYDISSGTYMMVGEVSNGFGNPPAYVVVGVDGTFEPAYAITGVSTSQAGITSSTVIDFNTVIRRFQPSATTIFPAQGDLAALNGEIPITNDTGLFKFSWIIPWFQTDVPLIDGYVSVELEEKIGAGAWAAIPGTLGYQPYHVGKIYPGSISGSVDHIVGSADRSYRLSITAHTDPIDVGVTLVPRFDIRKVSNRIT